MVRDQRQTFGIMCHLYCNSISWEFKATIGWIRVNWLQKQILRTKNDYCKQACLHHRLHHIDVGEADTIFKDHFCNSCSCYYASVRPSSSKVTSNYQETQSFPWNVEAVNLISRGDQLEITTDSWKSHTQLDGQLLRRNEPPVDFLNPWCEW